MSQKIKKVDASFLDYRKGCNDDKSLKSIDLFNLALSGDKGARDKIIESFIPLAIKKLDKYSFLAAKGSLEDIHSQGFLSVVKTVDSYLISDKPIKTVDELIAFVINALVWSVQDYCRLDGLVRTPRGEENFADCASIDDDESLHPRDLSTNPEASAARVEEKEIVIRWIGNLNLSDKTIALHLMSDGQQTCRELADFVGVNEDVMYGRVRGFSKKYRRDVVIKNLGINYGLSK